MAKKPGNCQWVGFSGEQLGLLDHLDFVGNNAWASNGQSEMLMPKLLGELAALGVTIHQVKDAMAAIGYGKDALHQLDRWESKRTTGRFGR